MKTPIYSTHTVQLDLFKEYEFVAPKLHVEYPDLSAGDILKCELYVNDLNLLHEAKLIVDIPAHKALIIKDDVPGFIQKRNDQVMVYYKDGTNENISQRMSLLKLFDHYGIVKVTENDAAFNFNGIVNLVQDGRS